MALGWWGHGYHDKVGDTESTVRVLQIPGVPPIELAATTLPPADARDLKNQFSVATQQVVDVHEEKRKPRHASPTPKPSPATSSTKRPPLTPVEDLASKLTHDDPVVRVNSAKALLKMVPGEPRAISALVALLSQEYPAQRRMAAEAMSVARVQAPDAISALSKALADEDPSVAYSASVALGRAGPAALAAVPDLAKAMGYRVSGLDTIANSCKEALIRIGPVAVPGLIAALNLREARMDVIDVLGRFGPAAEAAVPALTTLESDPAVAEEAREALLKIKPPVESASN
jgi:HEAT repeat protein